MDDLISKAAALDVLVTSSNFHTTLTRIEELPSVDAVRVVRCRDCKYWKEYPSDDKLGGFGICSNLGGGWDGNEFCSDGERRDDDG